MPCPITITKFVGTVSLGLLTVCNFIFFLSSVDARTHSLRRYFSALSISLPLTKPIPRREHKNQSDNCISNLTFSNKNNRASHTQWPQSPSHP